ncbi:MAG: DUF2118 domain-containing protein, partial [Sneathiella sp.]
TYGPDRATAISEMSKALDSYDVQGIAHNINFLNAVCNHPRFKSGNITTGFIAEEYPEGFFGADLDTATYNNLVAIAALVKLRTATRTVSGIASLTASSWVVSEGLDKDTEVTVSDIDGGLDVTIDGQVISIRSAWVPGDRRIEADINGAVIVALLEKAKDAIRITHGGAVLDLAVRRPRLAELSKLMPIKVAPDMSKYLLCPMPGMIVSVSVSEGDEVKAGQALAVVEAMKMENILRAEQDGVVAVVKAAAGDTLAVDAVILEFE